jgi:hypothetical protein
MEHVCSILLVVKYNKMSHNGDEDEDEALVLQHMQVLLHVLVIAASVLLVLPEERGGSLFDQRLAWDEYCERHTVRGTFRIRMRMERGSFDKLLGYIREELLVNETYARRRGGTIVPELCLYCTLRYLAGGSYLDICDIAGISKPSFYRVIWKTISVIVKCPELKITFPTTRAEISSAISGFASISTGGAIHNCVGVIDGYLMRIKVPSKNETPNVRSFFSGHYQCYGVNIQAASDHLSRFTHFSFAAPGVTGDRAAIKQCSLHDSVEALPVGICCIGDAAYGPTEHMVPVYQGADKLNARYDNFNFFASQCRIRVEMAFGMMQMKWGILQRPLGCTLKNMIWLAQGIARLHNYCIDERVATGNTAFEMPNKDIPRYVPTVPHDARGDPIRLDALFVGTADGYSHLREYMSKRVERLQLERPTSNRKRKRLVDEEEGKDQEP